MRIINKKIPDHIELKIKSRKNLHTEKTHNKEKNKNKTCQMIYILPYM